MLGSPQCTLGKASLTTRGHRYSGGLPGLHKCQARRAYGSALIALVAVVMWFSIACATGLLTMELTNWSLWLSVVVGAGVADAVVLGAGELVGLAVLVARGVVVGSAVVVARGVVVGSAVVVARGVVVGSAVVVARGVVVGSAVVVARGVVVGSAVVVAPALTGRMSNHT